MKKTVLLLLLAGCAYTSPPRSRWSGILNGASNSAISPTLRLAKRPLYQDAGGGVMQISNVAAYMDKLEARLENTLRKPGIQINRIGTDITLILVRSSIIYTDSPDISESGDALLRDLAGILNEYDMTWVEITGYTDAMRDQTAAMALSKDMADRVAVYLARHGVKPIRMFLIGRGSSNPISDQSDIGRLTNLRVEIRMSAVTK
jgi:outer membrane protein OmpA-like peptidoglycan-associated protein